MASTSPTYATETVDVPRTSGVDRFATCAAVSAAAFTTTNEVVIASGTEYPDGLSAAAFAGEINAPVMLVPTTGTLPAAVTAEIARLGASIGHIMGGTAAVSADMQAQLQAAGLTTLTRYPGIDRYDTSRLVAQALSTIGTDNGKTTAFVTTGEVGKWADALAASGPAFSAKIPVVLTTGASLNANARTTFTDEAITRVVLVGGTASVTETVESDIEALGIEVERIAGATREETAAELARYITEDGDYGFTNSGVVLTGATDFADSLCAGPYAGTVRNPVLFAGTSVPAATSGYLIDHAATIATARIIGGTSTIPDSTIPALETAAGGTTPAPVTPAPVTPAPPVPTPTPPAPVPAPVPAPPTVSGIAPATGPDTGGTATTITGTGFTAGATVTVGGVAATSVTVVNATTITATTPANVAGLVDVVVTSGGTPVTATGAFTYLPTPTISGTVDASGPGVGGTAVTITGTGFTAGATVLIGGVPATGVTVVNGTTITATTAARCPGVVDVAVTSGGITVTQTGGFTYTGTAITVTMSSPGGYAPGQLITIVGTNFLPGATVKVGTNAATNVTLVSPTSITANVPSLSAGPGTLRAVSVTVDGCTATSPNGFDYD